MGLYLTLYHKSTTTAFAFRYCKLLKTPIQRPIEITYYSRIGVGLLTVLSQYLLAYFRYK